MKERFWISSLVVMGFLAITAASAQEIFLDPNFTVQRTEGIVYGTAPIGNPPGDFELVLDLYEPVGPDTPRPGFVISHGGGFSTGLRNNGPLVELATQMAARGYVAVSIDYRLSGQSPIVSHEFQALLDAIEDSTNAYRWLVDNANTYNVDVDRIAVGGDSAGSTISMAVAYVVDDYMVPVEPPVGRLSSIPTPGELPSSGAFCTVRRQISFSKQDTSQS